MIARSTTRLAPERNASSRTIGPWVLLTLLSLAFLLDYVDRQIVFDIFPLLQRDLAFSAVELGLAGSLFTWTYSLMMPVAGWLADVAPRQRLILAALVLWSLATLGSALSRSPGQFLWWRVAMGISESLYLPAAVGMITKAHPGPTRSRALSIHGLAQFAGIALGGWYGGWSAERFGWRWGFAVLTCAGGLYAGFLAWRLRGFDSGAKDSIARKELGARKAASSSPVSRDLLRSRCYPVLCLAFFAFCGMLWMLYAWLPDYLFHSFHLSLSESGLTATLYLQISSAAGILLGGVAGDRLSRRHFRARFFVLIVGLLACAPFAWGIFETRSLWMLKLYASGFGLFAGLFAANVFSALYDLVALSNFGLATGLLNLFGGLGGGAAILLAGVLQPAWSASHLMLVGAGASIGLGILLAIVILRNFEHDRNIATAGAPSPIS